MTENEDLEKENIFVRWFKRRQQENVRETIEDLIEEAAENGDDEFNEHEQLLLNNVLDLRDRKCGTIMIPRAEIVAFHKDGNIVDLAELMISEGHSRIPIYADSLDDIVGVVHVIDLMKNILCDKRSLKASDVLSNNFKFVSADRNVADLLKEMQQEKIHIAMVVDEYGGVDGLVTIEDLLEEIVGDIEDEYDHEEEPVICNQKNGCIMAEGKADLEEISEICGVDLYAGLDEDCVDEIDNLNSLVFHFSQRVPEQGEVIDGINGIKFKILEADQCQIKKALIMLPQKEVETAKNDE